MVVEESRIRERGRKGGGKDKAHFQMREGAAKLKIDDVQKEVFNSKIVVGLVLTIQRYFSLIPMTIINKNSNITKDRQKDE